MRRELKCFARKKKNQLNVKETVRQEIRDNRKAIRHTENNKSPSLSVINLNTKRLNFLIKRETFA